MPIEIRNEKAFIAALEDALAGEVDLEEDSIVFVDWPRYEVTIRGEDFDGGVPTRVMPAFMEIQRAVNRAYARSVYGDENKRLSARDRRQTEIVVRLQPGSTTFKAEVAQILNSMVANMTGAQSLTAIIVVAGLVVGLLGVRSYLAHRLRAKELQTLGQLPDVQIRMTEAETRRTELLTRLIDRSMDVADNQQDIEDAHRKLMNTLHDDDHLVMDGAASINGYDARRLVREPRRTRVHGRVDGRFLIQMVESGNVVSGHKARIKNVDSEQVLTVNIAEGVLTTEQVRQLQTGEWSKTPLVMSINTERIGDRIVSANLTEARLDL